MPIYLHPNPPTGSVIRLTQFGAHRCNMLALVIRTETEGDWAQIRGVHKPLPGYSEIDSTDILDSGDRFTIVPFEQWSPKICAAVALWHLTGAAR